MYKTSGVVNESLLKSIKKYTLALMNRVILNIAFILLIISVIVTLLNQNYQRAFELFCVLVLFIFLYEYLMIKNVKVMMKSVKKVTGKDEFDFESFFEDDGIHVSSFHNDSIIQYESINSMIKEKDITILISQDNQVVYIFHNQLNENEKLQLMKYIQSKPTHIKWKKGA